MMEMHQLVTMIQGANVLACLAIATFFARWWRNTADTFFLLFALAFGIFAINRAALVVLSERDENLWPYVIRLGAFLLIAAAIVVKNRARASTPS